MKVSQLYRSLLTVIAFAFLFGVTGCGLPRNPVPLARISDSQVAGFSGIRYWDVQYNPDVTIDSSDSSDCSFLALSGGGAKGAFGAGFLNGWTDSGTRPEFKIVTGISTGALIAPLAFLGPEYDDELAESYTTIKTKDILNVQGLLGFGILPVLFGESYASTEPLQNMISDMLTPEVFDAIAREHKKGRRLYIGTTNLDAQRFVAWDMGAIASNGHPDAIKLFGKVMLASASIPGAFPPVYFDVEVDGKKYDEMHVDGGTIAGVFGYGALFTEPQQEGLCNFYVIKNGKLDVEPEQVRRHVFPISVRSFSTLMKAQSWGDMIRLYGIAQEDNVDFNYISLPYSYEPKGDEMFDPEEMKRLYDLGYSIATSDNPWQKELPLFRKDRKWIWTPAR
ncbi:MAG: patatin-like phospholipase family protein [Planctomycetota bacterium]|jgi:predicted patatin/cPLA2 family phospholipase